MSSSPTNPTPSGAASSSIEPRPAADGADLFLRNMRALWRVDPELALRVDAVNDDERVPLEPTRSGAWTAAVPAPDGTRVYLHSRYDPLADAERFAAGVEIEDKFCFVVLGFGLGYHVRALLQRLTGDTVVVCVEPSLPLLAAALTCVDVSDVLAARRLIILTDDDKARLHDRLRQHAALMMLGAQIVRFPPALRLGEEVHNAVCRSITEFVSYTRMSLVTLVANARITCRNIAMNLGTYVSTPPIDMLRDRFRGVPGVVVSAGPSLSRNIDLLSEAKGNAILCAVQTALKPLMQRGIVPDFVTSLDYHEMSARFFEGLAGLEQVHLVVEPKVTWHVLDRYPGPVSVTHSDWAELLLGESLASRGGLKSGATVAHLAFYLLAYMGCDPIIFVGQDLAFTGHVFYVPGVEIHRAWWSELNRFQTMEMKEWERIARNRPILRRVQGYGGTTLYSDELLFTYLEQFEKDIAAVPMRVINATEGGARIRGTQELTLREALSLHCTAPLDPQRWSYRSAVRWRDETRLEAARQQLSQRLAELEEAVLVCDELLTLLEELKGLTHDPPRFNQRLVRVDELRTKIHQSSRAYRIINSATQLAEFQRFTADRRLSTAKPDQAERARRQIERDVQFIGSVRSGAVEVRGILAEALDRLGTREPAA